MNGYNPLVSQFFLLVVELLHGSNEARMSDEKLLAQERGEKYRKLQRRLLRICSLLDEDAHARGSTR
eukprot:1549487-Amphidinium_carterae.1